MAQEQRKNIMIAKDLWNWAIRQALMACLSKYMGSDRKQLPLLFLSKNMIFFMKLEGTSEVTSDKLNK